MMVRLLLYKLKRTINTVFLLLFGAVCLGQPSEAVDKVLVIFKTHLDVGYTDLASKVEQRYINNFIPQAIAVAEQLHAEGSHDRYVWTTGSWLIDAYFKQASPEAAQKLEDAIRRGDIVWNGVPYTFESEAVTKELFTSALRLSQRLDKRFGKTTIAAKMTDVPGHTRSIISPLHDAGIRLLHIGVNPASVVPAVPALCRWQNTDGKSIILMYQSDYGEDMILPNGTTAVSINFTGDNLGPHSLAQVKAIYAGLRKKYPNAKIVASTLNAVATDLEAMTSLLPVVTSEIGDTWIYGYASSPAMMAKFRALSRLYSDWIKAGKIDAESDVAIDFAVRLGMVAEHTWGLDVKTFLKNWDKYDVDAFAAARNLPEFRLMEASWNEKADNIRKAILMLPENLRTEAEAVVAALNNTDRCKHTVRSGKPDSVEDLSVFESLYEVAYQTFSPKDFNAFYEIYARDKPRNGGWAQSDFGKLGLEHSKAQSVTITALNGTDGLLVFPAHPAVDKRVLPAQICTRCVRQNDSVAEITVSLMDKPANRLPEAYWVTFRPENIVSVFVEKMGTRVDVMDVVEGGNRQMHGIDGFVDVVTDKATIRITSLDAPVVAIGERNALNYSTALPDLSKGVHFCLFNNLWGTNFTMWWEGSISYRFKIEKFNYHFTK